MKPAHQKAVLVTGGAKRIGQAVCDHLYRLGYAVALHYNHSQKDAADLARRITSEGGQCALFHCDLNHPIQTQALIKKVKKEFPGLRLLINNASIYEPSSLQTTSLDSLDRHFNINFKAPFILTQEFARNCREGHIINILDTNITKNHTDHFTYLLSKKALYALTGQSAVSLAPRIRVNAIAPGYILNPVSKSKSQRKLSDIPLKRKGDVDQINQSIEFLIYNEYLTGEIIFNDGGEHLLSG